MASAVRCVVMIKMKDVSFSWGNDKQVLNSINIQIPKGEFVLVSGKSGSGKSTLGSALNGLIPHYYKGNLSGKVIIEGREVRKLKLHEIGRIVGTVFQDPRSQFFTTTTDEEIAFGLQTTYKKKEDIEKRVEEVYRELNIENLKNKSVFELSGGEKQKIAIASTYAMKPKVMILDEPSANLDMKATEDLQYILKILKSLGTTIVLIEHRIYYAKSLFDRVILINKGKIESDFSRSQFLNKDRNYFEQNGLRLLDLMTFNERKKTKSKTIRELFLAGREMGFYYKHSHGRKKRERRFVFRNLNFEIEKGKVIAIIGKNGAGKTTLARTISGISRLSEGEIYSSPYRRQKTNELLKQSYFVFQDSDYQLFSESVLDEMTIGIPQKEKEKNEKRATSILKDLGISEYMDDHPFSLSRGEKQRLTIACGLMKTAKLFIYDEPTSGCDRDSMLKVCNLVRLQAEKNITCLIISHDYEFLMHIAQEIWVLDSGKIVQMIKEPLEKKKEILNLMTGGGINV